MPSCKGGTYVSDKTKEILVVYHEDSLMLLNPKTKKIFLKQDLYFYVSMDKKDTLKISVIGDIVRDNYLGIRASDNPKRMFDFFDSNTKASYNYMYFLKENLQGSFTSFETGQKIIIDVFKNTFTFKTSSKKETVYKIYSIDYPNHKIIIWNEKKQKEEVIFKLAYQNLVIEYKGKKYHLSE
ncbi:MAG: hypothetical protein KatS3mg083_575 [Candidatus Dojkabacteria bacterium]|nr:MAG: hypothetical protein KatS3mg083_575 [Candidatus Dojkabacteria bacterium]